MRNVGEFLPNVRRSWPVGVASFRADGRPKDPTEHYMDQVIVHGSPERRVDGPELGVTSYA